MSKRDNEGRDPEDQERRRVVQGGLLAAAAALGFLPGCGRAESPGGAAGDSVPGAGAPAAVGGKGPVPAGRAATARPAAAGTPARGSAAQGGGGGAAPAAGTAAGGGEAIAGAPSAAAGMPAASMTLPRAMLGKTGVSVPIVALGTSRLGQRGGTPNAADFDNMVKVFTAALDMGIEYVDTGAVYGRAEEALGIVLAGRRDKVFLATKLYTDTYSQAQQLFERSLERLKTDHVDLLHLHSAGERNIDTVLSQDGSWRYLLEQKAAGRTRFVGTTGHSNPPNFMRMLATDQVDVLMTIMNFVDHSTYGFSKTVREEALARGAGVMAMKVFGGTQSELRPGGGLANSNSPEPLPSNMQLAFDENVLPDCMRFVKGLGGVTGMVIGINAIAEIERNIRWAAQTQPFSAAEMEAIIRMGETVAPMWAERYG
jgi:predicted aldo/keto reductase-like oxidoreductase